VELLPDPCCTLSCFLLSLAKSLVHLLFCSPIKNGELDYYFAAAEFTTTILSSIQQLDA
jgi:hypothetical protein